VVGFVAGIKAAGEDHGDLVPALDLEKHGAAGVTPPTTCISPR